MILPPYVPPTDYQNTGDLGFRKGGGTNIYSDPNLLFRAYLGEQAPAGPGLPTDIVAKPTWGNVYQNGSIDLSYGPGYGGADIGMLKRVYENQDNLGPIPKSLGGGSGPVGPWQQTVNGQTAIPGQGTAQTSSPFQASNPSLGARDSESTQPQGFGFGQQGQPGYQFMPGQFSSLTPGTSSQFFQQQPSTQTAQGLGTFQPWQNPAIQALQQSRGTP